MAKAAKKDTNVSDNLLDELGLGTATETTETVDAVSSDEFEFGELPPSTRTVAGGSKYGFEKFPAPPAPDKLPMKLIPYGPEPEKTKRSVQSAVTQANKTNKASGKVFRTRDMPSKGGIYIIRAE